MIKHPRLSTFSGLDEMLIEEIKDILTDLLQFLFDLCPVFLDVWEGGAVAFGLDERSCVSNERVINRMLDKPPLCSLSS